MSLVPRTEEANLGLLQYQVMHEMYKRLFFARFTGFVKVDPVTGEEIPPEKPIIMKTDFESHGMDSILIPMLKNLTQVAKYGDAQVTNQGEKQDIWYNKAYINQRIGVVKPPARMGNQRIKRLNLFEMSRPQLSDWLARDTEVQIMRAFYRGHSENILAATADGGLGISERYHPAIFTPDAGRITWSGTTATYANNIHTAVNGWAGADNQIMSSDALWKFRAFCNKREIPAMNFGGIEVRPLLLHTNQVRQLTLDPEFMASFQHGAPREFKGNPIFNGMFHFYAGFALFEREFSVFGISTSASDVTWGATNPKSAVDTYPTKAAVTFGPSAICGGWAFGPHFEEEVTNHAINREVSIAMIDGYARGEHSDSTSSPSAEPIQKSSALLLTYSPD